MINDEPISAFAKNKSQDDFVTVNELLQTLKGNIFSTSSPQAPVIVHSFNEEDDIHLLKIVFKCGNCKVLHFEAGDITPDDIMINENSIIYADYTHSKTGYVSRKELIEILEKFITKNDPNTKIDIRTSDDNRTLPLTEIFKCSSTCPSVHLCSGYYEQ